MFLVFFVCDVRMSLTLLLVDKNTIRKCLLLRRYFFASYFDFSFPMVIFYKFAIFREHFVYVIASHTKIMLKITSIIYLIESSIRRRRLKPCYIIVECFANWFIDVNMSKFNWNLNKLCIFTPANVLFFSFWIVIAVLSWNNQIAESFKLYKYSSIF